MPDIHRVCNVNQSSIFNEHLNSPLKAAHVAWLSGACPQLMVSIPPTSTVYKADRLILRIHQLFILNVLYTYINLSILNSLFHLVEACLLLDKMAL